MLKVTLNIFNILVLSDNIFTMFIQNDNIKIMKCLKKLFSIYERSLYMKKLLNFQKFRYNIILLNQHQSQQFGLNINKQNIHDKLFSDIKRRQNRINELARKINEDEEKNCSFTPQINKKIIFNPFQSYTNNISRPSRKINSISYCKNGNNKKKINYKYNPNINSSISYNSSDQNNNYLKNPYDTIDNNNLKNDKYYYLYSFDIPKYVLLQTKNKNKSFSEKNKFRKNSPNKILDKYFKQNHINNHIKKPFYSTSIPENLSLLFSSRLHIDNKKLNNKIVKPKKIKKSIFDNSSSSNYNEKGTNYLTESRTEHLSSINHELNYSKKIIDNKKKLLNQSDNNHLRNGINPYSYSASRKSTYYVSPKSTERNNLITNKNNNYYGTFSNYVEYTRDDYKINPNLRKKKNNDISNKSNNINSVSNLSNYNTTNTNSNNNNKIYSNNRTYNKNLEVERNVVNEKIIYNKDDERLSRRSSNSHMTIQTISDSKLFDLANIYVRTDESLERFRFLNKYHQKRRINSKKKIK